MTRRRFRSVRISRPRCFQFSLTTRLIEPKESGFHHPGVDARRITVPSTPARSRSVAVDLWALARQNLTREDLDACDRLFPDSSETRDCRLFVKELSDTISRYQSSQWQHQRKDGFKIVLHNVMDKTLIWVDTLKDIGYSLTSLDPTGHAAQVWGGLQFVSASAVRNIATRDLVFDVERITKTIQRCTILESLYRLDALEPVTEAKQELKDAQINLYHQIYKYLITAIAYVRQSSWKHGLNALVFKDPVADAMNAITSAHQKVQEWTELVKKEESLQTKKVIDEIRDTQLEILERIGDPILAKVDELELLRDEVHSQRQERILNWVSMILPANRHLAMQRQRKDGTGGWILANGTYTAWKSSSHSCSLWMYGKGMSRFTLYICLYSSESSGSW